MHPWEVFGFCPPGRGRRSFERTEGESSVRVTVTSQHAHEILKFTKAPAQLAGSGPRPVHRVVCHLQLQETVTVPFQGESIDDL